MAQLGARLDGIEEVVGSNPIGSTINAKMSFFVYVLQSQSSGRFYVGQTTSLPERIRYHNANYSRSLKNRGPWNLVYSEEFGSRSEAVRREMQIKRQKDRKFIAALVSASR